MLRNKVAHLGQPVFRMVGLPHENHDKTYVFAPRQWPFIWERYLKARGNPPSNPALLPKIFPSLGMKLINTNMPTTDCQFEEVE
jgi:hypothetical protein